MEPEEYLWFHLAHELGWPVSIVKQLVPLSEFEKWPTYFAMRKGQVDKADYHAAQVAQAIYAVNSTKAPPSLENLLLKFEAPEPIVPEAVKTKEELMKEHQSMWVSLLGAVEE